MFSSRAYPYSPHGRSLEILRGRGILKAKLLEEKYENKLEFPAGTRGYKTQRPSIGEYGYFLELHNVIDMPVSADTAWECGNIWLSLSEAIPGLLLLLSSTLLACWWSFRQVCKKNSFLRTLPVRKSVNSLTSHFANNNNQGIQPCQNVLYW